jgi:hypothetical protein
MTARRSAGWARRPLVVSALALVAAWVVACGTPNDPSGRPSTTGEPSSPAPGSEAPSPSSASEPAPGASYFLRVEPGDGDSVTLTLLNELVEPAASATVSGAAMETSGALTPGTYTVEAAGATCEGELQLADGAELDAIVRIDAAAGTCAVEVVGAHGPGDAHRFVPR